MVYTLKRRNIPAEQYSARILFSLKKDENSDTCFSTNFEDIALSEISQSRKVKYCMIHLHEGPRVVRLRETESGMVVPGPKGGGNGKLSSNGYRVSGLREERVLLMDGDNGRPTV